LSRPITRKHIAASADALINTGKIRVSNRSAVIDYAIKRGLEKSNPDWPPINSKKHRVFFCIEHTQADIILKLRKASPAKWLTAVNAKDLL
jgi:hypothetical protein